MLRSKFWSHPCLLSFPQALNPNLLTPSLNCTRSPIIHTTFIAAPGPGPPSSPSWIIAVAPKPVSLPPLHPPGYSEHSSQWQQLKRPFITSLFCSNPSVALHLPQIKCQRPRSGLHVDTPRSSPTTPSSPLLPPCSSANTLGSSFLPQGSLLAAPSTWHADFPDSHLFTSFSS